MSDLAVRDVSEFVMEPTVMTQTTLVQSVLNYELKYQNYFSNKGMIERYLREVKIQIYLKSGMGKFKRFLDTFLIEDYAEMTNLKKLEIYLNEFKLIYDRLTFNNFVLAYCVSTRKAELECKVETKEDEKLNHFKKLGNNEIDTIVFKQMFGSLAVNAFELSERRFIEYSDVELLNLAAYYKDLPIKNKPRIESDLSKTDPVSALIYLREYAKFRALQLVAHQRACLIQIADDHPDLKPIFNLSFTELKQRVRDLF